MSDFGSLNSPHIRFDFCGGIKQYAGSNLKFHWLNDQGAGIMSQHTSFKSASKIAIKRNVLKRFERVDVLRGQGKWKAGDRGQGLPKTKSL